MLAISWVSNGSKKAEIAAVEESQSGCDVSVRSEHTEGPAADPE